MTYILEVLTADHAEQYNFFTSSFGNLILPSCLTKDRIYVYFTKQRGRIVLPLHIIPQDHGERYSLLARKTEFLREFYKLLVDA